MDNSLKAPARPGLSLSRLAPNHAQVTAFVSCPCLRSKKCPGRGDIFRSFFRSLSALRRRINNNYGLEQHSRSSIFTHDSSGRMAAKRAAHLNGGRQPFRHRSRDEPALLGRQANRTAGSHCDLGRLRTVFCCAYRHWHMRYLYYWPFVLGVDICVFRRSAAH